MQVLILPNVLRDFSVRSTAEGKQAYEKNRMVWDLGSHTSVGISVPLHFWLRWPGDVARGILWAGGHPFMTGCLECSLARPVLAQSWSQTTTDGAWYSTTALLSGRDRPLRPCVLRQRGSKPETRCT